MYWRSSSLSWHINYLQYGPMRSECFNLLCLDCALWDGSAVGLFNMKIWVRNKKKKGGDKGKKPHPLEINTPPPLSADFQTNIMITIFWPFGVCCFRLWQSRQKKPGKKKKKKKTCSNMVLRVYSDHTICFLKSTFKTLLWAVPTALSLKLRLTLCSPLYYFPSV